MGLSDFASGVGSSPPEALFHSKTAVAGVKVAVPRSTGT